MAALMIDPRCVEGRQGSAWRALILACAIALLSLPVACRARRADMARQATTKPPALQFHYMGPPAGSRIAAAAGVPGDAAIVYLGAASGGLWKSTDGGHTFMPIFDDAPAIGAIAVAPADPDTVWVGTGEPWLIRVSDIVGDGVYKSTNGGKTWRHMGLVKTGRISRIVINPENTNNVFVCAEGMDSGPQQSRGVFRTTNGGKTWKRTLFVNVHTGCSGLSMDPANPDILLAGTWQVKQRTWEEVEGGRGSGVYISHDNGRTWQHLTTANGLPKPPLGKISVAIAPSNPRRMYAVIPTLDQGSLWRSDDGGQRWKVASWNRNLTSRAGYYDRVLVNPKDANGVLILNSIAQYSSNGGRTFSGMGGKDVKPFGPASCGDCHDGWIDPTNPQHYILTDDGGAEISTGAGTALAVALPIGQIYHVTSDDRVPYRIYGNRQDDGTWWMSSDISQQSGNGLLRKSEFMPERGPLLGLGGKGKTKVNQRLLALYPKQAAIPKGWALGPNGEPTSAPGRVGYETPSPPLPTYHDFPNGCESGFTEADPVNPDIVWSSCWGNQLMRFNLASNDVHEVSPSEIAIDSPPSRTRYRCHWTTPLAIDPFNHNDVYYGCQMVLRTSDAGHAWIRFSPDLSTNNSKYLVGGIGVPPDNLGQSVGEAIWSLAFSPIQKGLLWAGTNYGQLWYTTGAESATEPEWIDVTRNLHLPPRGEINQIAPSYFHAGTVYIAVDFRLAGHNNDAPYLLMTTDFGKHWRNIDGDIPSGNPLDYVLSVAADPDREGMLFAGTARAFYYTLDNGTHWTQFKKGLPPAPVDWINIQPHMHDIDVSTYGRGVFIMPDITTFEQTGSPRAPSSGPTRLFKPGRVFRMTDGGYPSPMQPARPQFQFYLASKPRHAVQIEILDAQGQIIRSQKLTAHQGLNGYDWNLMYNTPTHVRLLTTPAADPYIWQEARFQGKTERPALHWGINPRTGTPIAAPGKYQIRLSVAGTRYTQAFQLVKNPQIASSDADLQASTTAQVQIADAISETSHLINTMERWRKQIQDQLAQPRSASASAALEQLDARITGVENELISPEMRLSEAKQFGAPFKVYMNLLWLSGQVGQGVEMAGGGSDYAPTAAQLQLIANLQSQLAQARSQFTTVETTTIPAFNDKMHGAGISISERKQPLSKLP
ncbi:MAG: glycoside hydrolase [Metallibacterium scheffleri]|uniref:sialidase family protein n=1 Tax=Metallibacterium scheffleri TaxID=993689 RepID=UPI0026EBFE07|nr:sialidase family protein [Metallibacterium scheffleri]MCK9365575.1 glycoside hydrolase [Metallibacterium scheffleri]